MMNFKKITHKVSKTLNELKNINKRSLPLLALSSLLMYLSNLWYIVSIEEEAAPMGGKG